MAQVKPMRADARRNRERLLRAAAGVFAEHGAGASLDDIARRAEVGTGTLYRHFPTRQALLEAVYLESVEAIAARADTIAAARPPGAALVAWLGELAVGMLQVRGLKALLGTAVTGAEAVADRADRADRACGDCVRGAAERLVRAAQEAGAVRGDVAPIDVLRLVHGVVTACESAGETDGTAVRRYLSLLMEGLTRA
ncbi:TetR/AcrR family transcriptional regulator [Streptomyces olivaceus]|uniref:TetR/AcrR family transcriptional regulator n=1 Tax=Streptomyces TaxID=1883 RepID=UPI0018A809F9|nr:MULTISPECIES: TetR/AcrR family transcriptional regulator [Streptomyces]MBF8175630.1 TetR/AcrR family transcriptional regulator [Streptomyces olivaceus]UOG82447.1 TetR/AcrR family transcriptional regulator [Streptomyces sp. CB09030]